MSNTESIILKKLGAEIRKRRKIRGWSQEKLSQESEVALKHISEIESGQRNVGVATLNRIVKALGICFADLFEFTLTRGKKPSPEMLFEELKLLIENNPKLQARIISELADDIKRNAK